MTTIKAEIVADSINENGCRITSFLLTYPRIIHSELMTHRAFSRNSASSRAIPFSKMVEAVQNDLFIPIAWQKDHKGMQGVEYLQGEDVEHSKIFWIESRNKAVEWAIGLHNIQVTKQLCNRLLEPFMWHTTLVTATDFENFFQLRSPQYMWENEIYRSKKDMQKVHPDSNMDYATTEQWLMCNKGQAEIHIMALAEAMWDSYNDSKPNLLLKNQWHIPFESKISSNVSLYPNSGKLWGKDLTDLKIKISTAMCARTSYTVVGDEKEFTYEKQIALHDKMVNSKPFHASPFEHCAENRGDSKSYRNFKGWKQYRQILENQ